MSATRRFLRDFWLITAPYWRSEERLKSGGLLAVVITLNFGIVFLNVLFNQWYGLFYDALQNKDFSAFTYQLARFCVLAALFIAAAVYRIYLRQMLQIRWRRWLTQRYAAFWLQERAYYRLQLTGNPTDNPDQRISEDVNGFVTNTLILSLGLLEAVATLAAFAAILWNLSGSIEIAGISIPGYLLWAAIIYALIGSWLTHRIGLPLIGLNYKQQQLEADLRFSLVRVRENAESIALYGGEQEEAKGLAARLARIVANWWNIMRWQKRLTWFSSGYGQIAVIFPLLMAAPRYFSGAIQLGGLIQTGEAFGQVQTALSWFVNAYTDLAEWKATVDRLVGFEQALREVVETGQAQSLHCKVSAGGIAIQDLDIWLPDGTPLLTGLKLTLPPGSRVLVSGPSGCGKSTLLRTINGIWPYCRGSLCLPAGERLLFLPQKAYLPIGPLRNAVTYPDPPDAFDDNAIRRTLADCGLASLTERLDETCHWTQLLSPGEQQRVAFARALLLRPAWLFLDEATSALDEDSEARLYQLALERLDGSTIVSVAHRRSLAAFHDMYLVFWRPGDSPVYQIRIADLAVGIAASGTAHG